MHKISQTQKTSVTCFLSYMRTVKEEKKDPAIRTMENWERTPRGKEDGRQGIGGPAHSLCVYGSSTVNHVD